MILVAPGDLSLIRFWSLSFFFLLPPNISSLPSPAYFPTPSSLFSLFYLLPPLPIPSSHPPLSTPLPSSPPPTPISVPFHLCVVIYPRQLTRNSHGRGNRGPGGWGERAGGDVWERHLPAWNGTERWGIWWWFWWLDDDLVMTPSPPPPCCHFLY